MSIVFSYEIRMYVDEEIIHTGGFVIAESYAAAAAQLEEVYSSCLEAITHLEAIAPSMGENIISCYDISADRKDLKETEAFDRLESYLKENAIW